MADATKTTYFVLDGLGPTGPEAGWNAASLVHAEAAVGALRLSPLPSPPTLLKDAAGTFGGMENPTGVAVAPNGDIYVSDSTANRIFRVRRHDEDVTYARFFRVFTVGYDADSFVWVPSANRLERWLQGDATQVEVISKKAWNRKEACRLLLCYLPGSAPSSIVSEAEALYPATLSIGCVCQTSVKYRACLGGEGNGPRQFRGPRGLAISSRGLLYVADSGNDRIQCFDLETLALKHIWGRDFRNPTDVAVDRAGNVWIADKGNARLQRYDCRKHRFRTVDGVAVAAHFFEVNYGPDARQRFVYLPLRNRVEQWTVPAPASAADIRIVATQVTSLFDARLQLLTLLRAKGARNLFLEWDGVYPAALEKGEPMLGPSDLAIDTRGRVYVIDGKKDYVRILDPAGRLLGQVLYRGDLKAAFPPTAIAIDGAGKLLLASASGIHRFVVQDQPAYDSCTVDWTGPCGALSVTDTGRIFAASSYGVAEVVASTGFEKSGEYRSGAFDSGIDRCSWDKIQLSFADGIPNSTSVTVTTYTSNDFVADADIAALEEEQWLTGQTNADDFLVLSAPGRYLWLRIRFAGGGASTPVIQQLKAWFPRNSYLQYLPAVYQSDAVSRDFLDRFLRLFQTLLESIEVKIDHFADYLNADGTPAAFLAWLAGWIAMTFDPAWPEDVRRRLLRHAGELYRIRGTPAGLKLFLKLAFGIDAQLLEHYRLRKWTVLGDNAALGSRSQLWGRCITARLELDVYSSIGQTALVGTGSPLQDLFSIYAHNFSVFVPASVVRSQAADAGVRALVEREKPAHTQFSLVPLQPRFRVGVQSTLGLDSVVGSYPKLYLNESNLGFNTLLGGTPRQPRWLRVGVNSVLR